MENVEGTSSLTNQERELVSKVIQLLNKSEEPEREAIVTVLGRVVEALKRGRYR